MSEPTRSTSPCKGEVGRAAAGRESRFARTAKMTSRARRLRANMTDAERKLWQSLRRGSLNGFNFRRQHPVGPYTLDFYCPQLRLGIEIDGGQHAYQNVAANDHQRNQWLTTKGILILRFWNNDVLTNIEGVLAEIVRIATDRARELTPSPPLPLSGGGGKRGQP